VRLLLRWRAEMLFGEREVLVTAKHPVNGDAGFCGRRRRGHHHILRIITRSSPLMAHRLKARILAGKGKMWMVLCGSSRRDLRYLPELRDNFGFLRPCRSKSSLRAHEARL
jgi:hypothetical protein